MITSFDPVRKEISTVVQSWGNADIGTLFNVITIRIKKSECNR